MLSGANRAAVIHLDGTLEIIHFRDAVQDAHQAPRFTLSTLLRGRRGTEVFTGGHVSGEAFVLLDDISIERRLLALSALDTECHYRAVGEGGRLATPAPRA